MTLRTLQVRRYVTPLREGGSLPALVEAEDEGLYVLKFRGAGQGPKVLVAELIAGGIARALELPVPELVFLDLDTDLARTEPDPEIQSLIRASGGLNIGMDFLPGSVTYDPVAWRPDAELASKIVWFDALVTNVDRTVKNVNLLVWHRQLHLIDHGAALYFHHDWQHGAERARDPFARIRDHVLLPLASRIAAVDEALAARLDVATIRRIVADVPDDWLTDADGTRPRDAYTDYLERRLRAPRTFVEEALRARSQPV
jgi:hypothetical protein